MRKWAFGLWLSWACAAGCDSSTTHDAQAERKAKSAAEIVAGAPRVSPPFAVRGEGEGLLLVWYDEQGAPHTAKTRAEVPEAQRERVRVDSLELAPDQRLDPAFVYVADLRSAGEGGNYVVRKVPRDAFEAAVSRPASSDRAALAGAGNDVIIYGASWCGACKEARRYFEHKGVPFVEKDIEREPGARNEMIAKAQAQGVNASGIPVIDVYGTLVGGFDPTRMESLLANRQ